jgi:hydroxyacylglutathione hydrolase
MPSIIPIPAFSDNYIWLVRHGTLAAVVDPGDAAPVLATLAREGLELVSIVTTHHHADHVGGNLRLLAHRDVPVLGPARESIPGRTRAMADADRVEIPGLGLPLTVIDVPGHTAGHIAYFGEAGAWGEHPVLFCGDTLFAAGCGRLFEGTAQQMWSSLSRLAALPDDTRVYCAHEYTLANLRFAHAVEPASAPIAERRAREQRKRDRGEPTLPSVLAEERMTNPFLRAAEPEVMAAARAHAGANAVVDAVTSFAALRAWKNGFA